MFKRAKNNDVYTPLRTFSNDESDSADSSPEEVPDAFDTLSDNSIQCAETVAITATTALHFFAIYMIWLYLIVLTVSVTK